MHLDRDPDRSPSPSPPPFADENSNDDMYDEAELLASIVEKEAEMRHTEELINQGMGQVEIALSQLHRINYVLEQCAQLAENDVNTQK